LIKTSNQSVFAGCIPALMTPCTAAGQPDFDALAAKGKELVDTGVFGDKGFSSMRSRIWPRRVDFGS